MAPSTADGSSAAKLVALPGRADLLARAQAMVPVLQERAERTEQRRSLFSETVEDFRRAGFWRMLQPRRHGGLGLDVATHVSVVAELARGCASSAWVLSLISQQNFLASAFSAKAKQELFGPDGELLLALVMGPAGRAEPVPAGFRLHGRWPYVSGIDQCTWAALTSFDPASNKDDRPRPMTFVVPRDACVVLDDWHVLGMRGTGSKTVALDGVFVPAHRGFSFQDLARPAAIPEGPTLEGVPLITLFAMAVAAPAPGIARAAVAAYEHRIKTRRNAFMTAFQVEQPLSQMRLAEAVARVDAAHLLLVTAAEEMSRQIHSGQHIDVKQRTRYRLQMVEVLRICVDVVVSLFADAGTGAIFDASPLQRSLRDILVLRSHAAVNPDNSAENFGRILLDLPPNPPFI